VNSSSYLLTQSLFYFTVSNQDTTPPIVVDFYASEIARTYAKFTVIVNEPIVTFWMNGLSGMVTPTSDEIKSGSLDASRSNALLSLPTSGYIDNGSKNGDNTYSYVWKVDNLTA
jgi:hypothetical protein